MQQRGTGREFCMTQRVTGPAFCMTQRVTGPAIRMTQRVTGLAFCMTQHGTGRVLFPTAQRTHGHELPDTVGRGWCGGVCRHRPPCRPNGQRGVAELLRRERTGRPGSRQNVRQRRCPAASPACRTPSSAGRGWHAAAVVARAAGGRLTRTAVARAQGSPLSVPGVNARGRFVAKTRCRHRARGVRHADAQL